MWGWTRTGTTTTVTTTTHPAGPAPDYRELKTAYDGATLVAQDGTFLGIITEDKFNTKSIANKYCDYGNKFNTKSILNKFGEYGNTTGKYSPFNRFADKPPLIIVNKKPVAYLTLNTALTPRLDPFTLCAWLGLAR